MKPRDIDRCLREFRAFNKKAQAQNDPPTESIREEMLDQARRETACVIRFRLSRGIYPFAPGSRRFCLTVGAA